MTELDLRMALKDSDAKTYAVPFGTVVTPSAAEYLRARRVELVFKNQEMIMRKPDSESRGAVLAPPVALSEISPPSKWDFSNPKTRDEAAPGEKPKQLFFGPDGGSFDHKPESLTHLKGRQLVHKDHPVIIWRGKLDTFCARVIEAQALGFQFGNQQFVDELEEILTFARRLLANEIRGKEVEDFYLLGLDEAALRERSHDPMKFYGHRHMMITYKMGPLCVSLNTLRTLVREVELSAIVAFKDATGGPTRDDIIRALNRLSSLFYIMIFNYLPLGFEPDPSGI